MERYQAAAVMTWHAAMACSQLQAAAAHAHACMPRLACLSSLPQMLPCPSPVRAAVIMENLYVDLGPGHDVIIIRTDA